MPLFASKQSDDETSRRYLASAPPGARTEVLTAACTQQIRELPVAAAAQFGKAVTVAGLEPASRLVRKIMHQDRDLSAFIARKIMMHFKAIATSYMPGTLEENIAAFGSAMGFTSPTEPRPDLVAQAREILSPEEVEQASALAAISFAILRAVIVGGEAGDEYRLYVKLYTGDPDMDVEAVAYDVIAWTAIAVGRLMNRDLISPEFPMMAPKFRDVPAMDKPGWYPNPPKIGGMVNGDAVFQRFWDGAAWTDQVRMRDGRRWVTGSVSLHDEPAD
jgi:hypothetical protein